MEEKYEVGKWYFSNRDEINFIAKFSHLVDDQFYYTELYFTSGRTVCNDWCHIDAIYKLATPNQIETCLKAYAFKNVYVDVVKIEDNIQFTHTIVFPLEYEKDIDALIDAHGCILYTDGEWIAKIAQPSIQDKQDKELTENIHEYLSNQDLEKMSVMINGYSVSLLKCVEVYRKSLEIKDIIG